MLHPNVPHDGISSFSLVGICEESYETMILI